VSNKIQGIIALVIGGVALVRWFKDAAVGTGSYQAGHSAGMLIGSVIFLAAALYFFSRK
jgi:hypothetical protein